ncbi:MAG TPA: hypothetical protein VFS39_09880 [Nitrospira sp.]|nr:hypothetical protein [Nitrospira sp.]
MRGLVAVLIGTACTLGCQTVSQHVLEKSAQTDELRKETETGVPLPPGCPVLRTALPPGKKTITLSYREPSVDQQGMPLKDLAYTTIYLRFPQGETKAIRVWTNDASGGALVTVRDIPVPAQEVGLCVTASNWARKESPPGSVADGGGSPSSQPARADTSSTR